MLFWYFLACAIFVVGFLLYINLTRGGPVECYFCGKDVTADPNHCCDEMQDYITLTSDHFNDK